MVLVILTVLHLHVQQALPVVHHLHLVVLQVLHPVVHPRDQVALLLPEVHLQAAHLQDVPAILNVLQDNTAVRII